MSGKRVSPAPRSAPSIAKNAPTAGMLTAWIRMNVTVYAMTVGFALAATALVGQNLGAHEPDDAERSGWEAAKLSIVVAGLIGLGIFAFADPIARVFIGDPTVIAYTVTFIRIHAVSIPAVGAFFAIDGALRGAGDTRFPLMTSLSGIYGIRLPLSFIF